ncbi:MAG: hypothetical protein WA817_14205 [Candidatus Acidiferrum sp.]
MVESALPRAEQVRAGYGPVAVVQGIDLEVRPGEGVACLALTGRAPVRRASDAGLGVLLVKQHVRKVRGFADCGYELRRGRVVLQGAAAAPKALLQEIESIYLSAGGPPEAAEDIDE